MGTLLYGVLKASRPRQWLKNVAVFTTILFTGQIFEPRYALPTFFGFIVLCALSSASYLVNDVLDVRRDRLHPFKKFRPIASGKLPIPVALVVAVILVVIGLYISTSISHSFFLFAILFAVLQFSYSLFLKHISVIDILMLTLAYFIRVYAGEAITGYHISIWLALAAFSLALFLAVGKRRAELTLINGYENVVPKDTRATLMHYSEKLLDTYTAMFANSTFITYAMYTFLERPSNRGLLFKSYNDFTDAFTDRKWMMITIPFVLYGIMRYMQLIYEGKGESPEKILTSDMPLLTTVVLWIFSVILVIYGIGG